MKIVDFIKKKIFFKGAREHDDEEDVSENNVGEGWLSKIKSLWSDKDKVVDDEVLDKLEEVLIAGDVGVETTCDIISRLETRMESKKIRVSELNSVLTDIVGEMIDVDEGEKIEGTGKPWVIMMIGVNGVGKTTTIGKLANIYKKEGKSVVIGAADTFRAGAVEQLKSWCDNAGVKMISGDDNSNPSSVAFNTVQYAVKNQVDVAIIDTAGRLQNKIGLMEELSKMRRVIKNFKDDAPQETFLVLDASTGQNVFSQLEIFVDMLKVNGLIITKMDGIAKSGFLIGAINKFKIPVKFIGTGEKIDDIYRFDTKKFIDLVLQS